MIKQGNRDKEDSRQESLAGDQFQEIRHKQRKAISMRVPEEVISFYSLLAKRYNVRGYQTVMLHVLEQFMKNEQELLETTDNRSLRQEEED